jgi:hypothetical protein
MPGDVAQLEHRFARVGFGNLAVPASQRVSRRQLAESGIFFSSSTSTWPPHGRSIRIASRTAGRPSERRQIAVDERHRDRSFAHR